MISKKKITEKLKNFLLQEDKIIFSYIHGSFLDKLPFQDIDVALYIEPKKVSSSQAFDYAFKLSVDLSKKVGLEVDVQIMNYASLGFKHSVLKNGELLFSKDESLRLDLIEDVSLEYMDFYELSLQYIRDSVY